MQRQVLQDHHQADGEHEGVEEQVAPGAPAKGSIRPRSIRHADQEQSDAGGGDAATNGRPEHGDARST